MGQPQTRPLPDAHFLSVDILATLGLVYLGTWLKNMLSPLSSPLRVSPLSLFLTSYFLLLIIQLITVLPHHPYYYSYFNPIFGGGPSAIKLLRIGWGEGMDQVGAYLAAKPNSRQLVVGSRFTHNMLGFDGELISLGEDGRWTKADYIVLYIQQVQRGLEPSPSFIKYFQTQTAEKIIRLGDIDYAWIYHIPFTVPANPQVSRISGQVALLGYRWIWLLLSGYVWYGKIWGCRLTGSCKSGWRPQMAQRIGLPVGLTPLLPSRLMRRGSSLKAYANQM